MQIDGKTFVLAGQFAIGDKSVVVAQMIEMAGGKAKDGLSITKDVSYLVLGERGASSWKDGKCPQEEKANQAKEKGQNIRVVSEATLLAALADAGITFETWSEMHRKRLEKERNAMLQILSDIKWDYDSSSKTLTLHDCVLPNLLGLVEDAEICGAIEPSNSPASHVADNIGGTSGSREYGKSDLRSLLPWRSFSGEVEIVDAPNLIEVPPALFAWSPKLASAHLPAARIIGNAAFFECSLLCIVSMPEVVVIGNGSFAQCRSLSGVLACPKLQHIGSIAFSGCKNLEGIRTGGLERKRVDGKVLKDASSSLCSIGEAAFMHCEKLKPISYYEGTCLVSDTAFHCSGVSVSRNAD